MPKTPTTPMRPERKTEPEANLCEGTRHRRMITKAVASITIWMSDGIGSCETFSPTVHSGRRPGTEPIRIEQRMPIRKIATESLA